MQSNRCGSIVLYNTQSAIMSEYTDVSRVKLSSRIPPAGQMSAEGDIVTIAMVLVWLSGVKITSVQQVPAPPTLGQKRPSTEDEDDDEVLDESGFWNAFQGSSTSVSNRDQARRGVGERQSGQAGSADTQAGPSLDQECQVSGEIIDEAIGQDGSPSEDQMTGRCGPVSHLERALSIL